MTSPAQRINGFTLIELMITVAILAILLAIAIPAYQNYSIRTKVSEGLYAAAPAKIAVVETYHSAGTVPDQAATGYTGFESEYVASVAIANDGSGVITITTQGTGANPDPIVLLRPTLSPGDITIWRCEYQQGRATHLPAECRNEPP